MDAVHFVHGVFAACLWCLRRVFIATPSGRSRYNVLGAIDAVTHDFISVCNTTYINAESVCLLLEKIALKHIQSTVPITLVLDNARYQHCRFVMNKAAERNMELLFLPSYSPNLNIIERLWKWTQKDCLNCKYYSNFVDFVDAISNSLQKVQNKENKKELDTQLVLNFQLYDNSIYDRA
ncbi:transposase [Bacteroides heparinolyticus]|uniref:transposase n=1 Tax=Prevotella heparinolytica TaxID=28113 RepID=UPI00359F55E3